MIIYSCVWKFFWEGWTLGADHWDGEGESFMRNFIIKYWGGGWGGWGRGQLGLQSGLFYKNWGK
jgi:hypothetical protein